MTKKQPGTNLVKKNDLKYFKNDIQGYNNFVLINFIINRIECLQLISNQNMRVEFIYNSKSTLRNNLIP